MITFLYTLIFFRIKIEDFKYILIPELIQIFKYQISFYKLTTILRIAKIKLCVTWGKYVKDLRGKVVL